MKKKVFIIFLAAILLIATLTGCASWMEELY